MSLPSADRTPGAPRLRWGLLLATPALLVVVVVVVATLAILPRLDTRGEGDAEAGLARVGDDLALVIVSDTGDGGEARGLVVSWGLVAPVLALIPAAGMAWILARRVQRTLDQAQAGIESAEAERLRHLQEVVHELRTPLAVMGTNLELAVGGTTEDGSVSYIEAARRAVERMSRTVDDLAGHGQLSVDFHDGPVDLSLLARSLVAEHVGPGRARRVEVRVEPSVPVLVADIDPAAVRTAAGNFLNNAVRLAPSGSVVTVSWGAQNGWGWLAVGDEGPGLAVHLHARAFERGWRGTHDRHRATDSQGSGLGLTIARQLTEAQGGAVTIDSEEGRGSTFALWLPLEGTADRSHVVATDQVHPAIRPWRAEAVPA